MSEMTTKAKLRRSEPGGPGRGDPRSQTCFEHRRQCHVAWLRLFVVVGVLTIVVAACTGPDDGSTVSAASAPSSSTSANGLPVIVLVHGFDPTGQGYSCTQYWGDAEVRSNGGIPASRSSPSGPSAVTAIAT